MRTKIKIKNKKSKSKTNKPYLHCRGRKP